MLGFHLQSPIPDWLASMQRLPAGSWLKAVDGVQLLAEAKTVNPAINTVLRHWYDNKQVFGGSYEELKQRARQFFSTFIDDTFRYYAHTVDAIEEWNEYLGNGQSPQQRQQRIEWVRAVNDVWRNEYRTQAEYAHIRLVSANTAIGNDIPVEIAKIVQEYNGYLSYHAYTAVRDAQIIPDEWPNFSGRWTTMDTLYRTQNIEVDWLFTEMGAVLQYENGHLGPRDGWKHGRVYNGNIAQYINMMRYWLDKTQEWNGRNDNHARGGVFFTTGGTPEWRLFEIQQPQLNQIANFLNGYAQPVVPSGKPREQYDRQYWVIPGSLPLQRRQQLYGKAAENNTTAGPSFDDAGLGALISKTAVLWDIPSDQWATYIDWFNQHYPSTIVEFRS